MTIQYRSQTSDFSSEPVEGKEEPRAIAIDCTTNITALVYLLEGNLFNKKNYNLRRRMKRITDGLKLWGSNNGKTPHTTKFFVMCSFFSFLSVPDDQSASPKHMGH
jgi:hypothetical protein